MACPRQLNRTTIASVWPENAENIANQSDTLICDRINQEDDFMTTCEQHLWSAVEFAIYTGKSISRNKFMISFITICWLNHVNLPHWLLTLFPLLHWVHALSSLKFTTMNLVGVTLPVEGLKSAGSFVLYCIQIQIYIEHVYIGGISADMLLHHTFNCPV